MALIIARAIVTGEPALAEPGPEPFRLVDPEGRPHARVQVTVVGRTGSVTTDDDGEFRLLAEPTPPFELAVFDGRGALVGVVRVAALDGPASRTLTLTPGRTERITVISGTAPATAAPPAAAASVFSSRESAERRPARLVDALQEIPGAGQVGSGAAAVPSLRGLAGGRTLILLDDARVTAERRAGPSATFLDPFSLETVEIVRGPGSVAYGSDALGGIIHARTPVPRPAELAGRYEVSAAAGEEGAAGAFEINAPLGQGAILAQLHGRSTRDYRSPVGTIQDSSSRDRGVLLRGLAPVGPGKLLAGLQVNRARDAGKPLDEPGGTRTVYPIEDSERLTFGLDLPSVAGFSSLDFDGFLGRYRLVTDRESPGSPATVDRGDVEADDASLRLVGARSIPHGLLRLGVDVAARFDLRATDSQLERRPGLPDVTIAETVSIESARRVDGGLFVEVERVLPGLPGSVAAGLRGDRVETDSRGAFGDLSTSNDSPSGYVALTYHPARDWSGSIQYARGFRDPRLSDRYFQGTTGRGTIVGNPDLGPETSDQLDLALHARVGRARLAAYGYGYRIEDLVERFRVPGMTDVFSFRNRGAAELRGVEVEADVELDGGLALRVAVGYATGEIRDDGSPANDVPPESAVVSLRREVGERYWWRVVLSAFARDDAPGSTESVVPGYALLDASVGFRVRRGLEARVLLRNLADKLYPASSDDRAPPAPGRSLTVVLAGTF